MRARNVMHLLIHSVLPDFKINDDQSSIAKEDIDNEHEDVNKDDRYWYSITILFLAVIGKRYVS